MVLIETEGFRVASYVDMALTIGFLAMAESNSKNCVANPTVAPFIFAMRASVNTGEERSFKHYQSLSLACDKHHPLDEFFWTLSYFPDELELVLIELTILKQFLDYW